MRRKLLLAVLGFVTFALLASIVVASNQTTNGAAVWAVVFWAVLDVALAAVWFNGRLRD